INILVPLNNLRNYDQIVSTACVTLATCYNNYYVENFESIVANYFINSIKNEHQTLPMGRIKNLVFDHILDRVFLHRQPLEITEAMLPNSPAIIPELQHQVARLITSITNRLPAEPITKVTVSANPISVMSDFRHILETYETNI
ncbi:hypothetical protein BC941DRAFT_333663, partial [Chlamydoabsidia padenii]